MVYKRCIQNFRNEEESTKKEFAKTSRFFHYFRSIFVVEGSWRKREKNIQEIPIPVFAFSSAGSLKPREYHWNYTFYILGWPRGKYLLARRSEPPLGGGKGFLCSLYLLLPTSYASRRNPIRIYRFSRVGLYNLLRVVLLIFLNKSGHTVINPLLRRRRRRWKLWVKVGFILYIDN